MKALVISADPTLRELLRVALRSAERRTGGTWEYLEASNGVRGIRVAWRERPDVVVADEIASGAGAFAVAKDLRGATEPFPGAVIIVLARGLDDWLARWSGADAWLTRPVDPFLLSDTVVRLVEERAAHDKETA
jgi:DNA-binding response OmpR family regulator